MPIDLDLADDDDGDAWAGDVWDLFVEILNLELAMALELEAPMPAGPWCGHWWGVSLSADDVLDVRVGFGALALERSREQYLIWEIMEVSYG